MKFTISKAALQDLLSVVVSAVPAKSTLPILSNVLIQADKEGLTFVATDLDISIRTRGDADVKTPGSVTVPAKRIGEIVRELPDAEVKAELKDKKLTLTCGNGSFTIVGLDPEDFPQLPQVDAEKSVNLASELLEKAEAADASDSDAQGTQLPEDKHAGVPVQVGRGGRRRHVEEGDDSVVSLIQASRRTARIVGSGFLAACATMYGGSSGTAPSASASGNKGWVDSVMTTLSPRDRAAGDRRRRPPFRVLA
jgi:hypothetical protein